MDLVGAWDFHFQNDEGCDDVEADVVASVEEAKVDIAEVKPAPWLPSLSQTPIILKLHASIPTPPVEVGDCLAWVKYVPPDDGSASFLAALQESPMGFADHRYFASLAEDWEDLDLEVFCLSSSDHFSISCSKPRDLLSSSAGVSLGTIGQPGFNKNEVVLSSLYS